jgi:hypothetical protein
MGDYNLAKPEYKSNAFASAPTSIISTELIKYHKPISINRSEKMIMSERKYMDCGTLSFAEIHNELNAYSLTSDIELVEQFKSVGFTREQFQIFLALFDLFIANSKNDYKDSVLISLKDFHNNILGRKNRLRQSDIDNYKSVFNKLSTTFIDINTTTASIFPYKRKYKNKLATIYCSIANIAIITLPEYNCDIIEILPTRYFLFEICHISQISNYFPRDFIKLNLKSNDNIIFFGHYLVKMHRINSDKKVNNQSFWEVKIPLLVKNSLPDYDLFLENYNREKKKTRFIDRNVFSPLKNALSILKNNDYISSYEIININSNKIYDTEQKLKIIFKYKKSRLN